MAFTPVEVTGTVTLPNGQAAQDAVLTFELNTAITDGDELIGTQSIGVKCDDTGDFAITLTANDDTTTLPVGTYYTVEIGWSGTTLSRFKVVIPNASAPTVDLFSLAQVINPTPGSTFVSQLIAGTGVTLTPTNGTGAVTVNTSGGSLPSGGSALQVVGKDSSGTAGWLPALQIILTPSGDTTGTTDRTAINAALAAHASVILHSPGSRFWIDEPIQINTGNTLQGFNARVTKVNGANCNILANANALAGGTQNFGGTADSNMHVKGHGIFWLDGNATNQSTPVAPNTLSQVGIFWCNATGITVEDVIVGPEEWMACCSVGTTDLRWSRIFINQDRSVLNQDAIDVGPGCSNIQIDDTRGMSGDDCHSIWAKHGAVSGISNLCPWLTAANSAGASNLNSSDIRINNTNVDVGINCVRVQAGDGATLTGVHVSNFVKRGALYQSHTHCVLQMGTEQYVTTPPTQSQFTDIVFDGFSGVTDWILGADSNFQDVVMRNIHVTGPFTAVMGHTGAIATTCSDVELDINTSDSGGSSNYGLQSVSGDAWDRIKLTARMKSSKGILANAGTVTNLDADVEVASCTNAPVQSTVQETGRLRRLVIKTRPSTIFSHATKLILGADVPYVASSDTIPSPTLGSQITCNANIDPTGGSYVNAAIYAGDGTAWNRVVELANLGGPQVTGLSPSSGATAGATSVAITGSGFTGATDVKFGTTDAASFTVNSDISITASSPSGSAGTVDVTVITPIGTSPITSADHFLYSSGVTPAFIRAGGSNTSASGVTSLSATVPVAGHASGNTVFVAICSGASTVAAPTSVTDSKSNTYSIDNTNIGTEGVIIAHSHLTTPLVSGDTITAHWSAGASDSAIDTAEFSGVAASSLDQVATGNNASAVTALDGGTTPTLSQAVEVAIGAFVTGGATGGSTAGSGFTKLNDISVGTSPVRALVWEYKVTGATTAVDATATITTAHGYVGLAATYKGA